MPNRVFVDTEILGKDARQSLEDAVQLVAAVFEVNADFFVAQVVPSIQGAAERLAPTLRTLTNAVGSPPGIAPSPA